MIDLQHERTGNDIDALGMKTVTTVLVAVTGFLVTAIHGLPFINRLAGVLHPGMLALMVGRGHQHFGLRVQRLPGQQEHCQHKQVNHPGLCSRYAQQ